MANYFDDLRDAVDELLPWAEVRHEQKALGGKVRSRLAALKKQVVALQRELERAEPSPTLRKREPDDLPGIRALRPDGPRRLWERFDAAAYRDRLRGALLSRAAGCTLGAMVEMWPVERMERFARHIGDAFPPEDYWSRAAQPDIVRYGLSPFDDYARPNLRHVPVDDDITYTLLGLLILEEFGPGFTTEDVGKAWVRLLPMACSAEQVTLENLRAGVAAKRAGVKGNPYHEWIGADIRADPWGYAAPAWPERAAEMAWRDAALSHRMNGVYGAMYFAAAIAAAFTVDHPLEACRIALGEIPRRCRLATDLAWALDVADQVTDYRDARRRVDERFRGMSRVHTNNNACLTVFGLAIGGRDVTRVLGQTVAMGLDNDCTAATAGSIVGAVVGADGVPEYWVRPFRGKVRSYLRDHEWFTFADLQKRFTRAARAVWQA